MLRGFIECPQLTSDTGTPNAAATCSRSSGLGVQRPSAIAATRSTVKPEALGDGFDLQAGFLEEMLDGLHGARLADLRHCSLYFTL